MKNCIFSALFVLLLVSPVLSAQQQSQNPTLVFFVDHENQVKKDFVEIALQIEAKDSSLINAISVAAATVTQIQTLAKDFCNENAKKKADCKEIVDAGKFQVEPRYQLIRKEPVFMGFTVTHDMTIAVKNVENIGYLVDKILTRSGITLQSFQWKALEQPKIHEQAIAEGMEEGEGLCTQLGLKLGRIVSIEQVNEADEPEEEAAEEEEGQQEEQEEEEQETQSTMFRFEVECVQKSGKKQ